MTITEVRIKLVDANDTHGDDRLRAFASVTFDDAFVVRDLKIVCGTAGLFLAMPSRKIADRCECGVKNHLRARYCNACGGQLDTERAPRDDRGRAKLHADVAHPIHRFMRDYMTVEVLAAYEQELEAAKHPGYVSSYDRPLADDDDAFLEGLPAHVLAQI